MVRLVIETENKPNYQPNITFELNLFSEKKNTQYILGMLLFY